MDTTKHYEAVQGCVMLYEAVLGGLTKQAETKTQPCPTWGGYLVAKGQSA